MRHSLSALTTLALLGAAAVPAVQAETLLYGTGFEAPGFAVGVIGGGYYSLPQWTSATGWSASPTAPYSADPSPWAVVTDQRAAAGSQSLKLSIDPATNSWIGAGYNLTPGLMNLSGLGPDGFGIALRLYIDQAADADVTWNIGVADGYANLLGFALLPDNRVMFGHRAMSTAAFFTPGFDLKNTWLDLRLERNPSDASSVLLSISGGGQSWQQVVSSPGGAASTFYVNGSWPTFPLYRPGTAYVDDVRLGYNLAPTAAAVPEPGAWALLLAGAGVLALRSRRRPAQGNRQAST